MIPAINVGGEIDLVLAAEQNGGLGSDAAQRFAGSIDHIPLAVSHLSGLGESSAHSLNPPCFIVTHPNHSVYLEHRFGRCRLRASVIIANRAAFVKVFVALF